MNNIWVIGGIAAYLLGMLYIGFKTSRNINNSEDFIVAGRRLPLGLAVATLFATWFGGGTSMGAAGESYYHGFLGAIADPFGAGLCLILGGLFFVRTMRRMQLLTIADFFAIKYGKTNELLASIITIPAFVGWVAAELVALGFIVHSITGLSPAWGIVISALVVLFYTYQGGMWAVTITDFVQMIILVVGLLIIFPVVLHDVGGLNTLKTQIPDKMFYIYPRNASFNDWLFYIQAWLIVGFGSIPGQDLMQRSLSSKDENTAQNASYLSGIAYILLGIIPVTLGIVGRLVVPEIANSEMILVVLAQKYLPNIGVAIFVGALLSAIMSSCDSAILAPASIITRNIVPYFKKLDSKEELVVARYATLGITIAALVIALWFQNIYSLMVSSWAFLLVGCFVPLLFGIWSKKANTPAATWSSISGFVSWLLLTVFSPNTPNELIGLGVSFVSFVIVMLATYKKVAPKPLLDIYGQPIDLKWRGPIHSSNSKLSLDTAKDTVYVRE
jgi:SSS family solute:Na+ symporter